MVWSPRSENRKSTRRHFGTWRTTPVTPRIAPMWAHQVQNRDVLAPTSGLLRATPTSRELEEQLCHDRLEGRTPRDRSDVQRHRLDEAAEHREVALQFAFASPTAHTRNGQKPEERSAGRNSLYRNLRDIERRCRHHDRRQRQRLAEGVGWRERRAVVSCRTRTRASAAIEAAFCRKRSSTAPRYTRVSPRRDDRGSSPRS